MSTVYKIKELNRPNKSDDLFYCSVCNFPLLTLKDFENSKKYNCCHECYLTFVQAQKQEWLKGHRPNLNLVNNYINNRRKILLNS